VGKELKQVTYGKTKRQQNSIKKFNQKRFLPRNAMLTRNALTLQTIFRMSVRVAISDDLGRGLEGQVLAWPCTQVLALITAFKVTYL